MFPAAVLAVHQLRYLLAYGSNAGSELGAHGDHYVTTAAVIAGTLVAISLGAGILILVAVSRSRGHPRMSTAPLWLVWLTVTLLLVAGFCALEALEITFEPEHAGSVASIFGDGGWWALPAAMSVAGLMALLVRGGRVLLVIAARTRVAGRTRTVGSGRPRLTQCSALPGPMASCAAGRAPPLTVRV